RPDGTLKVTGEFAFSSDLWMTGMLWGATLRSPHPRARIRTVDLTGALRLPGIAAVLTHDDVPGQKTFGLEAADQPVLAVDEVRMQDQAFLGPESGLAVPSEDGGIELFVATQWLHVDQAQIADSLGLPEEKVRLVLAGVGGAFGAREDLSMQIHACLLALYT